MRFKINGREIDFDPDQPGAAPVEIPAEVYEPMPIEVPVLYVECLCGTKMQFPNHYQGFESVSVSKKCSNYANAPRLGDSQLTCPSCGTTFIVRGDEPLG